MITGFQLDISSEELILHLNGKRDYHKNKADSYKRQLDSISKLMEDDPGRKLQTNNPEESLKQPYKNHLGKSQFFGFCADHVIIGETYRLTQNDLISLEFVERFF